jgi:threonine/homoserine/homoserine lactone efflux protein
MGQAIGGSLVMAICITITPLAISAALFLVGTPRGRMNGPAFVIGWLIGLVVVGSLVLAIFAPTHAAQSQTTKAWINWSRLLLGLVLFGVAWYLVRHRRSDHDESQIPSWMGRVDKVKPGMAFSLGAVLSGARPKNLLLILAGGAVIAQAGLSAGLETLSYVIFVAVATIGVAVPVVIYFTMGDRAEGVLRSMEKWIRHRGTAITSILCVVVGVDLVITAFTELL